MGNGAAEEPTRTARGHDLPGQPAGAPEGELADWPTQTAAGGGAFHAAPDVRRHGPGVTASAAVPPDHRAFPPDEPGVQPPRLLRYGPGVPAAPPGSRVELTAEHVWRGDRADGPPPRRRRLGRLAGGALTVILLAASGVLLYLRFHHAPFHVTGIAITQQVHNGCGVDITGQITTNGSAGTVSYQWLVEPSRQAPQPLSQSVPAGQQAVYVTVAVNGSGHGSASQTVVLQVLGPDTRTASAQVTVSC